MAGRGPRDVGTREAASTDDGIKRIVDSGDADSGCSSRSGPEPLAARDRDGSSKALDLKSPDDRRDAGDSGSRGSPRGDVGSISSGLAMRRPPRLRDRLRSLSMLAPSSYSSLRKEMPVLSSVEAGVRSGIKRLRCGEESSSPARCVGTDDGGGAGTTTALSAPHPHRKTTVRPWSL